MIISAQGGRHASEQAQQTRHAPHLHQDVGRHRCGARRGTGVRARRARPGAAHQARLREPADRAACALRRRQTSSCCNSSARRPRAGCRVGNVTRPIEVLVRDSQSNPNRAAEVAKDLIVRDKIDLMLVGNTPETTNPVCTQAEIEEVATVSSLAPWQPWFIGQQANPAGGPPAWKPFNFVYHYFWGLEDVIAVFLNMWGQLDTNKVGRRAVPQRRRRQRLGRQGSGLPARARQAGFQTDRSGSVSEPHGQLRRADHGLQERQCPDHHRRGAAPRLHHLLEAGAAAGLQAQGRLGRQGAPVPVVGRSARQGRPQYFNRGLVVAEPSVQVVDQRHDREAAGRLLRGRDQAAMVAADRLRPLAVRGRPRRAEAHHGDRQRQGDRGGDPGHEARHRGRADRMGRQRRAALRGQECNQDARWSVDSGGSRTATSTTSSSPTTRRRRRSPSAARWNRSPEWVSSLGPGPDPAPRSIVRTCSRSAVSPDVLRLAQGRRRHRPGGRARRSGRHHRPQRRRQDHAVQSDRRQSRR